MFVGVTFALVPLLVLHVWHSDTTASVSAAEARRALFLPLEESSIPSCTSGTDRDRVECLIRARFVTDPSAETAALSLFRRSGTVAGVLPEEHFAGGYRGTVHLVPRVPTGKLRTHLEWTAAAFAEYDRVFEQLGGTPRFRWRALTVRYFESVARATPSAFATRWSIAYNVKGSLFRSASDVRVVLFHEVFHLNDEAHGQWSTKALAPIFDSIVAHCGARSACLAPFAPSPTMVKGGTYYAFQPGNGVREYGAELASRYYVEQRAAMRGETIARPFKCGTRENRAAWDLIVREFFGGVDRVPQCATDRHKDRWTGR